MLTMIGLRYTRRYCAEEGEKYEAVARRDAEVQSCTGPALDGVRVDAEVADGGHSLRHNAVQVRDELVQVKPPGGEDEAQRHKFEIRKEGRENKRKSTAEKGGGRT